MESEQHLLNLTTLELIRIIQDQKDEIERYETVLKDIRRAVRDENFVRSYIFDVVKKALKENG